MWEGPTEEELEVLEREIVITSIYRITHDSIKYWPVWIKKYDKSTGVLIKLIIGEKNNGPYVLLERIDTSTLDLSIIPFLASFTFIGAISYMKKKRKIQ